MRRGFAAQSVNCKILTVSSTRKVELPTLLSITDTAHAGEALGCGVLIDAHVFDDLSPADANQVAVTPSPSRPSAPTGRWLTPAEAVAERAIVVQLDPGADRDHRMAVGLALHRAALSSIQCRRRKNEDSGRRRLADRRPLPPAVRTLRSP